MRKMMTEKAVRGQTIRTETGPDRESFMKNDQEALAGRKMGGGPNDLSHSISGTEAQVTSDKGAKPYARRD